MATSASTVPPTDAPDHPGNVTDPALPVIPLANRYPGHHVVRRHVHHRAQLLCAVSGVMGVATERGSWVVPPQQAVWIPAGIVHEVHCANAVWMHSLYVHPRAAASVSQSCRVVAVTALLRELIGAAASLGRDGADGRRLANLTAVILDELHDLDEAPLDLPLPDEPRLRAVTDALRREPGNERTLAQWGDVVGASSRTLARLFVAQTGLTFAAWRQRLRLQEAVARLGQGHSVTRVSLDLGYGSPSAFVAMFRRALGAPPGRYLRDGPD